MVQMQKTGTFRFSRILLVALLCYTPILGSMIPATNFGAGIPDLDPLRALAYLLVLAFFAEYAVEGRGMMPHPWVAVLCLFAAIASLSPIWSEAYTYNTVTIQELFNSVILPVLVAGIASILLRSDVVVRKYCIHIVIASIILSAIALVQYVQGSSIIHDQTRSMATFTNPNTLAVYLVLSLAVVLYATDTGVVNRQLAYLAQVLLVLALFTTISRKGLLTMAIVFLLYYWATRHFRRLWLTLVLIVVVAVYALSVSQFASRFTGAEFDRQLQGKSAMAVAGLQMFAENPVLGKGYKGYYENFGTYFPNSDRDKYDAHNEYVTALANYGLVGFTVFMGVFLYPLVWGWKRLKRYPMRQAASARRRLLVGLLSLIAFMISQYFAGTLFYQNVVVFLLYANVALMLTTSPAGDQQAAGGADPTRAVPIATKDRRILRRKGGADA